MSVCPSFRASRSEIEDCTMYIQTILLFFLEIQNGGMKSRFLGRGQILDFYGVATSYPSTQRKILFIPLYKEDRKSETRLEVNFCIRKLMVILLDSCSFHGAYV